MYALFTHAAFVFSFWCKPAFTPVRRIFRASDRVGCVRFGLICCLRVIIRLSSAALHHSNWGFSSVVTSVFTLRIPHLSPFRQTQPALHCVYPLSIIGDHRIPCGSIWRQRPLALKHAIFCFSIKFRQTQANSILKYLTATVRIVVRSLKGLCTLAGSATWSQSGAVSRPRVVVRCNTWEINASTHTDVVQSDVVWLCVVRCAWLNLTTRDRAECVKSKRNSQFF